MPLDSSMYRKIPLARSSADWTALRNKNALDQDTLTKNALSMQETREKMLDSQMTREEMMALQTDVQTGRVNPLDPKQQPDIILRYPRAGRGFLEGLAKLQETQSQVRERDANVAQRTQATLSEKHKLVLEDAERIFSGLMTDENLTLDVVNSALDDIATKHGLKPSEMQMYLNSAAAAAKSGKLRQFAGGVAGLKDKLLPKTGTQDFGGYVAPTTTDPATGQMTVGPQTAKTPTISELETARRNKADEAIRWSADKRAKENEKAPVQATVLDPRNPGQSLLVNLREYKGGSLGSQGVIGVSPKEPGVSPSGDVTLPYKEMQKREAAFPKQQLQLRGFSNKSSNLVKDMETLRDNPGLKEITGLVAGYMPTALSDAGRKALADLEQIMSRGQFNELSDMRQSSPTGGALGNISDREGAALRAAFAALDRKQGTKDFKDQLDKTIKRVLESKQVVEEAFKETYSYRNQVRGGESKEVDWGALK